MDVEKEILLLEPVFRRLGTENGDCITLKFGVLIRDEEAENTFEAIIGTLRAAKKRGIVDFAGQMLLQGVHDDVDLKLYPSKMPKPAGA